MTKKDLMALADVVRDTEPIKLNQVDSRASAEHRQWARMRDTLASFCQSQHPGFTPQQWLNYIAGKCGPNEGRRKRGGRLC